MRRGGECRNGARKQNPARPWEIAKTQSKRKCHFVKRCIALLPWRASELTLTIENPVPFYSWSAMKQHKLYNHAWNVFETIFCEQCNNKHVSLKHVYSNHVSALMWTQLNKNCSILLWFRGKDWKKTHRFCRYIGNPLFLSFRDTLESLSAILPSKQ